MDALRATLSTPPGSKEVILSVSIGSFVAFHDLLAECRASSHEEAAQLARATQSAIHIERQRNIVSDSAYGIAQLETIAWTSISTAKSDPAPGILTIYALRDVLARWSAEPEEPDDPEGTNRLAVVYVDRTPQRLMEAFETLGVVASESMQHQSLAAIMDALATLLNRLPAPLVARVESVILRILSSLGDHVLTAPLDNALSRVTEALRAAHCDGTATKVDDARDELARTIGQLGSRSTRAGHPEHARLAHLAAHDSRRHLPPSLRTQLISSW